MPVRTSPRRVPALVVGGGQAGLAAAFYLRRAGVEHVVLDDQAGPGGAWLHTWESLRLFSPAARSSLPGWQMPAVGGYPDAEHVVDYLARYEERYSIPVRREVKVTGVVAQGDGYRVSMTDGAWHANSGAQMAVDLAGHADVTWCTAQPPRFLPDDVDGRELFRVASRRVRGRAREWRGDIVVVPRTDGPVAVGHPRLGFVGYGDWCGLASATLIGVGQRAREAVHRALGSR